MSDVLILDVDYWENRWKNNETGWDIGSVSTPIKDFFDSVASKESTILIPGCGNAWEGEYLHRIGFKNVYLVDIAASALNGFAKRNPSFPKDHLIVGDFFDLNQSFDYIVEQTFFCALPPRLRPDYVEKVHELLKPKGQLVGVLFNIDFGFDHPPYGGNKDEYHALFKSHFTLHTLAQAKNSIKPRQGSELFIRFEKRD